MSIIESDQSAMLAISGDRLEQTLQSYLGDDGLFSGRVGDGRFVLRPKLRSVYTKLFPWYVVGEWTPEGERTRVTWRYRPSLRLGASYAVGLIIAAGLGFYLLTRPERPDTLMRLSPIFVVMIWTIQHAIMAFTAQKMTRQAFEKTIEVLDG